MRGFLVGLRVFLLSAVLAGQFVGTAAAQDSTPAVAFISAPTDGQQLFGQVTIVGSAQHPSAFGSYTLEYNDLSDPNAPWLLVQPPVRQQVASDVLGSWNTVVVPDGVYRLRLRLFLQDGQVAAEDVVTGLRVINTQPTPLPTTVSGAAGNTSAGPTPGPSPTSPIVQPPSSNPAVESLDGPNSALASGPQSAARSASSSTRINTERVQSAFCTGVYLTIAAFAVMLIYRVLRGRLRPYTRRLLWQIQDEIDDQP